MIITEMLNLISDHFDVFVYSFFVSIIVSSVLSYIIIRRVVSGMIPSQIQFVVNFAVIIFLFSIGYIGFAVFTHFIFFEIFVTICMFTLYRVVLANRATLLSEMTKISGAKLAVGVTVFITLMIVLNHFVVLNDGSSRITYMTLRWFSYLRLVTAVVSPLAYFLAINLLESKRYILSIILGAALIVQNATAGSKAGFLIGILGMLMLHRDLNNGKIRIIRINPFWAVVVAASAIGSGVFILNKMGVGVDDVLFR